MGERLTGDEIRRRREDLGWSRVALAGRAGCSDGAIAGYERGSTPSPAAAATVAHALARGEAERFGAPAPAGPADPAPPAGNCDPSYPALCIPPGAADIDCPQIGANDFPVYPPDPHGFDGDGDGVGCES